MCGTSNICIYYIIGIISAAFYNRDRESFCFIDFNPVLTLLMYNNIQIILYLILGMVEKMMFDNIHIMPAVMEEYLSVEMSGWTNIGETSFWFRFPSLTGAKFVDFLYSIDDMNTWHEVPMPTILLAIDETTSIIDSDWLPPAKKYYFKMNVTGGMYDGESNIVEFVRSS